MHSDVPALFSATRIICFAACLCVALASGTNYVFSAYGPQLGTRLHLSHTQQNVMGLSGNFGVYGTAPFLGRLADAKGPRILLIMAFICLSTGYLGMRHFYDAGLSDEASSLSWLSLCLLVLCGFLTGVGGNGGLTSAMNTNAKSWPERLRGTANGIVLSGFGLSAFLFSTIAHVVYPGNTSEFLLVLAIGTSLPMVLGLFLIRPIPLSEATSALEHGASEERWTDEEEDTAISGIASPGLLERNDSRTHLLTPHTHEHDDDEDVAESILLNTSRPASPVHDHPHHPAVPSEYIVPAPSESLALSPTREVRSRSRSVFSAVRRRERSPQAIVKEFGTHPNVRGKGLFSSSFFWMLFTITTLCAGTGLMYINNVGLISQALFTKGNPDYDEAKSSQWQATQVSTISVMNCIGRISIGIIADFSRNYLHFPRSFCITLVAALFVISQIMAFYIDDVSDLWKASAMLGWAYGSLMGLFPTVTIEWFGLAHFSENWGCVSLSPMVGSNIFSLAFGRNLDAHDRKPERLNGTTFVSDVRSILRRAGAPSSTAQCFDGRTCYADTLKLTIAACCVALGLAIYAGYRDYQRSPIIVVKEVDVDPEWEEEEA
ncbi:MFS general substrate transporter [Obba rivulosa]|uniref:MFS general substrate transporter n=1 Tax=Obba rivulosa TaxID=1052685 RepID=A0A8E2DPA6_9APHY|nr:MFS general substrate transporter [Obba rivulosa]